MKEGRLPLASKSHGYQQGMLFIAITNFVMALTSFLRPGASAFYYVIGTVFLFCTVIWIQRYIKAYLNPECIISFDKNGIYIHESKEHEVFIPFEMIKHIIPRDGAPKYMLSSGRLEIVTDQEIYKTWIVSDVEMVIERILKLKNA
jgi:hypothetical protein